MIFYFQVSCQLSCFRKYWRRLLLLYIWCILLSKAQCANGEIGRHAGFRFLYRKMCGFKSRVAHHPSPRLRLASPPAYYLPTAFIEQMANHCDLCHFVRYKGNCSELRCLLHAAVAMKQTTKKWNLLDFAVCILRIRQHHSAIKSGVGAVVIPILQIFLYGKPELPFIGKNNLIQTFSLYCSVEIFYSGVHHRHEWR